MSQRRETQKLGQFTANGAIGIYLRVKRTAADASVVEIAGDEAALGTAMQIAYAAGDPCGVYQEKAFGTNLYIAGEAIAKGDAVTSAANGKVGLLGAVALGVAEHAVAGDGEYIEVGPPYG